MDKIMILGNSGSGKSTLARNMGEILGIEPTHLDVLHWLPGWVESTREHKVELLAPVLERARWIVDGTYRNVLWQERLEDADTAICLDINRFKCLYQAFKRSRIYKGKTRPDMGEGCEEKFDFEFVKWILFSSKRRKKNLEVMEFLKTKGKDTYIFKNNRQINKFLEGLKQL